MRYSALRDSAIERTPLILIGEATLLPVPRDVMHDPRVRAAPFVVAKGRTPAPRSPGDACTLCVTCSGQCACS